MEGPGGTETTVTVRLIKKETCGSWRGSHDVGLTVPGGESEDPGSRWAQSGVSSSRSDAK